MEHFLGLSGGPNCKSWSVLLQRVCPGLPVSRRDRAEGGVWGKANLSQAEQSQLDDESLLILRFLTIAGVAL